MLDGKKTYIGLIITLVGIFGLSRYVTPEDVTSTVNLVVELVGVAIAIYGRYVAKP